MDRKELFKMEDRCTEEHAPFCEATCPMHVDVRGMLKFLKNGDAAGAYKLLRSAVYFPIIVSKICDSPCQKKCKRNELDETVLIRNIEEAITNNIKSNNFKINQATQLSKKVAIIGAGMSGMTVAHYLYEKGYEIAIFEKTNKIGGKIRNFSKVTEQDILLDLSFLNQPRIKIELENEVGTTTSFSKLCLDSDAIYVSGLENSQIAELILGDEEQVEIDSHTFQTSIEKVFAGGSNLRSENRYSVISSISDGKRAAISIDRFLKAVSLTASRLKEGAYETKLFTNVYGIEKINPIIPSSNNEYSLEDAMKEAERCLLCRCMECVKECKYLEKFKKFPRQYIREIYNNLSIVMGFKTSKTLINSCSLCGLCTKICPNDIGMADVCKSAREEMVKNNDMPPRFHDFPIKDMIFSNSDDFSLCKHQPGMKESQYLFFPGCQLCSNSPQYIIPMYEYLAKNLKGGVGLMLGCCGAPADWAGHKDLFNGNMEQFKNRWHEMGEPTMITACPTCHKLFKGTNNEMELSSIWEIFDNFDLPDLKQKNGGIISIHDPCTSRNEPEMQQSIRNLLEKCNYKIEELKYSKELTKCCGYGGLTLYGNKELTNDIIESRINENKNNYVVYCSACKDYFLMKGKLTFHILDIILGKEDNILKEKRSSISEKRRNRIRIKQQLLKELWNENVTDQIKELDEVKISINVKVREEIEERLILEEEIIKVILQAEETSIKTYNSKTGHFTASKQSGVFTYWVEYSKQNDEYIVHNAYNHALTII